MKPGVTTVSLDFFSPSFLFFTIVSTVPAMTRDCLCAFPSFWLWRKGTLALLTVALASHNQADVSFIFELSVCEWSLTFLAMDASLSKAFQNMGKRNCLYLTLGFVLIHLHMYHPKWKHYFIEAWVKRLYILYSNVGGHLYVMSQWVAWSRSGPSLLKLCVLAIWRLLFLPVGLRI